MYQKLIASAEYCWIKGDYDDAIRFYMEALKHKQSGGITKKAIQENIKQIKFEQMWNEHDKP